MSATYRIDDVAPGVKLVTLNRPDRLNSLDGPTIRDLEATFTALRGDDGVRALVLTGEGRAFCGGLDREDPLFLHREGRVGSSVLQEQFDRMCRAQHAVPQPVIAAINGVANGAGLVLALGADIRIAAPEAQFGVDIDAGGPSDMCDLAPVDAPELAFAKGILDADEAVRLGLVSHIAQDRRLLDTAIEMASEIARSSPQDVRIAKQLLQANARVSSPRAALELEAFMRSQN
jgi:enoyl-CoA hydratase/carnithine racemase